jgi:transposase
LKAAADKDAVFVPVGDDGTRATEVTYESRRYVVVDSPRRHVRDDARRSELLARTEDHLMALADRVRQGRLVDPAKIGAAADRILRDSGVSRCFVTKIAHGENLLSGRYVITTSLDQRTASSAKVVAHYKALQSVERRFRVLKDFLALRPVFHYTEKRVRGHVAVCVLAAVSEAVITIDLKAGKLTDPDLEGQHLTARRALRELERIRTVRFADVDGNQRQVITRPSPFQAKILAALGVDTSAWHSRVA